MDDAMERGAVALFGEKYGELVRTLAVGDFSRELCGGTHVPNSGRIGLFRVTSETAISAGTRRIEAVTGPDAVTLSNRDRGIVADIAALLKVASTEAGARVAQLVADAKSLKKQLEKATAVDLGAVLTELERAAVAVNGIPVEVESDGTFRRDILLEEGANLIEVVSIEPDDR